MKMKCGIRRIIGLCEDSKMRSMHDSAKRVRLNFEEEDYKLRRHTVRPQQPIRNLS